MVWKPGGAVIHALLEAEAFKFVRPRSPPREQIGNAEVWRPGGGVIHALRQAEEAAEVAPPPSVSGYSTVDGDCGGGGGGGGG